MQDLINMCYAVVAQQANGKSLLDESMVWHVQNLVDATPRILAALRAIDSVRKYDLRLDEKERSPTGDDYNNVLNILEVL